MNPGFLEKNLALLENKDPGLAASLRLIQPTGKYIVVPSRAGPATLSCTLPDGTRKTMHSAYDPAREASRFADSCRLGESANLIVTGMGLGYHLIEAIKRAPHRSRIVVIEKDPELFLLALTCNDLAAVLTYPGITFNVGASPHGLTLGSDAMQFALNGYAIVSFKPLIDPEVEYYHAVSKVLENLLHETRTDFNTQAALSKSFYSNIIDNLPFILDSIGVNSMKNRFPETPAVVVSAGPALDKNIFLLRNIQDHIVLIAVATALAPLLLNGIEPDFVVAIDPDESMLRAFDLEKPLQKSWLLFDPGVLPLIPEYFSSHRLVFDSNIYLSQWIAKHNEGRGSLGKTQSVAHTAVKFAQHLGCKPVILTGQDLAFNQYQLHCSGSFYHQGRVDALGKMLTMNFMEQENYLRYTGALIKARDIFGNTTTTTAAMHSYNNLFANEFTGIQDIINASEGGIPIPRIQNLCLKEALNRCLPAQKKKKDPLPETRPPSRTAPLATDLQVQADKFKQLYLNLQDIKNRWNPGGNAQFVREMEAIYKTLVEDFDTIQLLQGYSYSEFLQWNQKHTEITKKAGTCPEEEILRLKLERDSRFIDVLCETADYLRQAFERMAGQASQHKTA